MSGSPSAIGQIGGRGDLDVLELARERGEVDAADRRVDLVAGHREQRVDRLAEAPGVGDDRAQRLVAVVVGLVVPVAQRELGAQLQRGQRRAQLVRDLAREALLVPSRRGDPGEQPVERRREAGELVARGAELEPAVQVVRAPVPRALGHLRDWSQRAVQRAADRERPGQHHERGEHDRADEHLLLEALDRLGGVRDDDRAHRLGDPRRPHRLGAQPDVVGRLLLRGRARATETRGDPVDLGGGLAAAAR